MKGKSMTTKQKIERKSRPNRLSRIKINSRTVKKMDMEPYYEK